MNPNTQTNQHTAVGAKDFFLYIGFIASFYTFVTVLLTLSFSLINTFLPDRQFNYFMPQGETLRFSISMIVVVVPIMVYLLRKIHQNIRENPARKEIWIRKWFLYLTLTLSVITLAVNTVVLINKLLDGEISSRFFAKIGTILLVGISVWIYTRYEIHHSLAEKPKTARILSYIIYGIVLALVITSVIKVGSPALMRNLRDDDVREDNLSSIRYSVLDYYQAKKNTLPKDLNSINIGNPYAMAMPKDPVTNELYEYNVLPDMVVPGQKKSFKVFELCATFAEDSEKQMRLQGASKLYETPIPATINSNGISLVDTIDSIDFSVHGAGRTCYKITIDPERYGFNTVSD